MNPRLRPNLLRTLVGFVICWSMPLLPAQDDASLRIESGASQVLLTLGGVDDGKVHHLEVSADLVSWREIAFSNVPFEHYGLPLDDGSGLYRVRSRPADEASDWTNQLDVSDSRIFTEPGAGGLPNNPAYAKFTEKLDEPGRVYFQDSDRYPFHYDFVRARLPGYQDIAYQEYENISLHPDGQELLVGTVILPPDPNITELAIQFTGNEPFPIEDVASWFESVRSRILAPEGWRFFYLPAYEQSGPAFDNEAWFADRGIPVDSAARWITENACYSAGWAFGRMKFFSAGEIDAAFGDGRLTDLDILVTDQVPAEIPLVAGVLTLAPATPNSHVAIQAKGFRIPFAHPSGRALQDQILSLDGHEVLLVVSVADGQCEVSVQDVDGTLTPGEREAILESKQAPEIEIEPIAPAGTDHLDCAGLTPDDIGLVGGKASNFGFLRRSIPDNAPDPAIALTFDL